MLLKVILTIDQMLDLDFFIYVNKRMNIIIIIISILSIAALVVACIAFSRTFTNKERFKKYNVDLITYADDESIPAHRKGTSYVETQQKMVKFFKDFFPQIQRFHVFGIKDKKSSSFYKNNPKLFDPKQIVQGDTKRKLGVYIYKCYLLYKVLKTEIKDKDFLLMHDANPQYWPKYFNNKHTSYSLDKHIAKCIKNKGVLMWSNENRDHLNKAKLASPELLKDLKATHLANTPHQCSSWILVQKTDHVLDLLERIINYAISNRFLTIRNSEYQDAEQDLIDIFLRKEGMNIYANGKCKIILDSFPDP